MAKTRRDALGDGVWLLTLTDPDRRNAMDEAMGAELVDAAAALAADPAAKALVVTGEGEAFCAGADLPALFGDADRPVEETRARLQRYYRGFLALRELAIPTIAAVNGAAVGAGLNLALACDVRVAGPDAAFGATFARIGLHPGGGCTWFLVQALGPSRALRTLLLGDTLDAERAVAWGLAEGPEADPVAAAVELARRFAVAEPALARHIKRSVRLAAEHAGLDAVLEYESWAQASSAGSDTLRAWVDRFRKA
ncbi:MAG TPA: enoyl-CoA hydratase [Egibacteraceae bacterium]|nr:enoyl-CoA hydratase [Egibacteraceae bacterium]